MHILAVKNLEQICNGYYRKPSFFSRIDFRHARIMTNSDNLRFSANRLCGLGSLAFQLELYSIARITGHKASYDNPKVLQAVDVVRAPP